MRRYKSYRQYLEELLGQRVQKVAINTGMGCPNRDGTLGSGGCTFCVNEAFTPSYCSPEKSVELQITEGIGFHKHRYAKSTKFLAYFQSFSNTYASVDKLKSTYKQALNNPDIVGLVIGTRPDCIDAEKLDLIAEFAKELEYVIVEYGVESVYDKTLERINRGHDFQCARSAIELTANRGIHVGAHFIIGLPGEDEEMILNSINTINTLPLNTIKFHQLQLFSGTAMVDDYHLHPEDFKFYSVEEYIDLFCEVVARLRSDIIIERFASEAPPRYHFEGQSPWGKIRNERLVQLLEQRLIERDITQGCLYKG